MLLSVRRALIYTRTSRDDTGEGRSVERQLEACRALAVARGWTVVGEESDNSISAWSGKERPGWDRTLAKIEGRQVDVLIAWHIDRMTRSMVDLETLILLAESHDVGVATATGDIDLTTDAGRMVARILAAVARQEVERKGARQRLANRQRAEEGKVHSNGHRPYGFEPDKVTLRPSEVEKIHGDVELLLQGGSLAEVAKRWGKTPRTVKRCLLSPRYVGKREYQGEVFPGTWPAILTEDKQLALSVALNAPGRGKGSAGKVENLLTGIATCSVCHGTVRGHKSNGKYDSYSCEAGHAYMRRGEADDWVGSWVVAVLEQPDVLRELVAKPEGVVAAAFAARDDAQGRLGVLTNAFAMGTITAEQLTAGTATLRAMLDQAEAEIARAAAGDALDGIDVGTDKVERQWLALELPRQRTLVDLLFEVEISPSVNRRQAGHVSEKVSVTRRKPQEPA